MSNAHELQQIEFLARVDGLVSRLRHWVDRAPGWEPAEQVAAILRRVLERVDTLRVRLDAPLVVATFGGTGTGKSSLVNALVGEESTQAGRQRPTTRQPILIAHPRAEIEHLGLPLEQFQIIRRDADLLRDIVLIDCPDPDTCEEDAAGGNLARLRSLLPHCDVLLYTSTQQKYRSARIVDELSQAASGCRLVFVQTHAGVDVDIREDWRQQLKQQYEVPDLFFVDSLLALKEQQLGQYPSGEMGRLINLLRTQLAESERVGIRRANVIDLLNATLERCLALLNENQGRLTQLEQGLAEQRVLLGRKMAGRLRTELLTGRNLWERRLLSAVTDSWGFSPFSSLLRLYNGMGALIASMSLFRARNTAQMAIIGAMQGSRWLRGRKEEQIAEESLDRASLLGLDDSILREAELVIEGHVYGSGLRPDAHDVRTNSRLRQQASRVEESFLGDARVRIEEIVADLSARNSRFYVRGWYELLFVGYIGFVLYCTGRNFFYEWFIKKEPLLESHFYIPAGVFFLLWSMLLVIAFTRRLRRGLTSRVDGLSQDLVNMRLEAGLFPHLEETCRRLQRERDEFEAIATTLNQMGHEIATSRHLGSPRHSTTVKEKAAG
ncbi:MAG: GTPase domain-containing protein [Planctomycetaceae bacterium]